MIAPSGSLAATSTDSTLHIARRLLGHAWPVLIAQLLSMGMMVADTIIAGRYATSDLAAVAVGNGIYVSLVMLLVGVLQAVAPTVAHHVGAGATGELVPSLHQGFWLAILLAVPGTAILLSPGALLDLAAVPPPLAAKVGDYLRATAAGLPAVLLYRTFYAFANALGRPRVLMFISLATTCIHAPLAWALVSGAFGVPLGGTGCGVSTSVVAWIALGCGAIALARLRVFRKLRAFRSWTPPDPVRLWALLRLGFPIGLSTFIEITSFTLIALLIARLGPDWVAAHRVVANLAALAYMLPLSLATSALVLVGQAAGGLDWTRAARYAKVAIVLTCALSTLLGGVLWLARTPVLQLWSSDNAVRLAALSLLPYICLYQVFDAAQTVASHTLRAYKVTALPMVVHTLAFWGVGLGLGYWLAFHAGARSAEASVAAFWQAAVLATALAALLFLGLLRFVAGRSQRPGR
ncbi:multidrug resistance protein [Azoarcus olearius]|uniref:Multidrug resistance protein n=1 Tax=Azoarcus sp. (strain BH72) TaxID=418699 RepID=A1K778_AZOSB|nr:multidrug resistance protein [Azoarcus olearius]